MSAADHPQPAERYVTTHETHIWTPEKMAEIKALLDVCAHIVGPADVLVLTTATPIPEEQMNTLPDALKGRVVIIDKDEVDVSIVRTEVVGDVTNDDCRTHHRPYVDCRDQYGPHRGTL